MARKTMVSVRLNPTVVASIDRQAAAAGQTRTEWIGAAVARAALTASGAPDPQPVDQAGDDGDERR